MIGVGFAALGLARKNVALAIPQRESNSNMLQEVVFGRPFAMASIDRPERTSTAKQDSCVRDRNIDFGRAGSATRRHL
jgi:hypothetical protein